MITVSSSEQFGAGVPHVPVSGWVAVIVTVYLMTRT
jgi:hypothetical protein